MSDHDPHVIDAATAEQALGLLIGALAGVVGALDKLAPIFDHATIYQMTRNALPKMVASEGGAEFGDAILAAALTQLIRQQIEQGARSA